MNSDIQILTKILVSQIEKQYIIIISGLTQVCKIGLIFEN